MRGLVLYAIASLVGADDLIDEYNNLDMGIAFTVIPESVWEGKGGGNNGMDDAGFYPLSGMTEFHAKHQQAVSIVTKKQDMTPYDGGYGTWGLAFHVTEEKEFWKYFQVAQHGKDVGQLVAGPGDGANHIPPDAYWRKTLAVTGSSYEWFTEQKNGILARYNTVYGNHDYNEFDTNGLAPTGLAGVFVNEQLGSKAGPSSDTMCQFLMNANPSKSKWPIYGYKWNQLYLKETLHCDGTPPAPAPPTPADSCEAVQTRVDCGYVGITQAQCEAKGCCWMEGSVNEPWCFYKTRADSLLNATKTVLI